MRNGVIGIFAVVGAVSAIGATPALAIDNFTFEVRGDEDLEDQLRESSLLVAADEDEVTDPAEILAAARAEYGRLIGALYSTGRYGGVINVTVNGAEAAEIPPIAQLGQVTSVAVTVDPGPVYTFAAAEIAPLAPESEATEAEIPEGYARGEEAPSGVIVDAAGAGVDGWRYAGHAKAEVSGQSVVADHASDTLAASIGIAPGPLVTFGDLRYTGSRAVRPERLRAIAGFPTGEVYDPDELEQVGTRLRRTQVFSAVALTEAEELSFGDRLDVEVDLVAYPPRRIGFGGEYDSSDGATVAAFWMHRNLLGGAERFRIEAEVSGIGNNETDIGNSGMDYSVGVRLERPATFSPENTLFLEARAERLNEDDYTASIGQVGFGITRYVSEYLEVDFGLAYRFSRVEEPGNTTDYSMLIAPLEATYDTREDPLDAKSGIYTDLGLTPFVGLNDETGSGARATWDARTYLSFGTDDRFTLAGRFQGGSILGAELGEVPNDNRFYSGGGGTVRGQPYESLGVLLDGRFSGGGSFVGLSAEMRAGVTDSIGVVAFYDYGIVGFDSFPSSDSESQSGAGLGLRYLTPIGPIRLDVATPVTTAEIEEDVGSVEVYVGIGQAF